MNILDYGEENYAAVQNPAPSLFSLLQKLRGPQAGTGGPPSVPVSGQMTSPILQPPSNAGAAPTAATPPQALPLGAGGAAPAPTAPEVQQPTGNVLKPVPMPTRQQVMSQYGLPDPRQAFREALGQKIGQIIAGVKRSDQVDPHEVKRQAMKDIIEAETSAQKLSILQSAENRMQSAENRAAATAARQQMAEESMADLYPEFAPAIRAGFGAQVLQGLNQQQLAAINHANAVKLEKFRQQASPSEVKQVQSLMAQGLTLDQATGVVYGRSRGNLGGSSDYKTTSTPGVITLRDGRKVSVERLDNNGVVTYVEQGTNIPIKPEDIGGRFLPASSANYTNDVPTMSPGGSQVYTPDLMESHATVVDAGRRLQGITGALRQHLETTPNATVSGSVEGFLTRFMKSARNQLAEFTIPPDQLQVYQDKDDPFDMDRWFGKPGTTDYLMSQLILERAIIMNPNNARLTDKDMERARDSITANSVTGMMEKLDAVDADTARQIEASTQYLRGAQSELNRAPPTYTPRPRVTNPNPAPAPPTGMHPAAQQAWEELHQE